MQAAASFILGNICLMGMEKPNDESYMGRWPKVGKDDANQESKSLEEELERIIQLADNISEKAESTAENVLDFPSARRQKGTRNAKKSMLASLVFGKRRTSLRSDKLSMRQPRLSPLAARAALAAAVTPLRQASQAGLSGKPQVLHVHSATVKADASSSKSEKKEGRIKKVQNSAIPVRRDRQAALARKKIVEPPVKETGSLSINQYDEDIQLIVEIPIYKDNYVEKAVHLTIDVPFLER